MRTSRLTKLVTVLLLLLAQLASAQKQVPVRSGVSGKRVPVGFVQPGGKYLTVGVPVGTLTLKDSSYVSAMIETEDGDLVRWLNKAELFAPGLATFYWNGKNEQDVDVTTTGREKYYLRYAFFPRSGGVTYAWEGTIGNSSSEKEGNNRHRSWSPPSGMCFFGSWVYYNNMYQEGAKDCWLNRFARSSPQFNNRIESSNMGNNGVGRTIVKNGVMISNNNFVVEQNGTTIFRNFVSMIDANTLAQKSFTGSAEPKSATTGSTYNSVIGYNEQSSGTIRDVAASDTMYVLVYDQFQRVRLHNATTGERSYNINNIASPTYVKMQGNQYLWVVNAAGLQKFDVTTVTGTYNAAQIGSPLLTINTDKAMAIDITPDGSQIAVVEAGTTQQVRFYSTATGALLNTLGQLGGYLSNATVTNDKYMFSSSVDNTWQYSFISFDPTDGSFWFGDTQNRRSMHFSASKQYLEQIQIASRPYSCWLDPNNSTRLFQGYLEYKIDYSKPLAPDNGSWQLVANWTPQGSIAPNYTDNKELASPVTLSNGRTYARFRNTATNNADIFELVAGGIARRCGTSSTVNVGLGYYLYPDGMRQVGALTIQSWSLKALTGFDASNNPIFASAVNDMVVTQVGGYYPTPGGTQFSPGTITSDGYYVSFDGDAMNPNKYHIGFAKKGKSTWRSYAAYSTTYDYFGPYPSDDAFDLGNGLGPQPNGGKRGYAGSVAMATGRHVFWGHHGEFYKNAQTNKWIHHLSNGLYIGQCGLVRPDYSVAPAGFGGNALFAAVAEVNGIVYFYHSEENNFSALHRWKVTGLNTIQEGRFKINPKVFLTQPASGGLDLHANLPFDRDSLSISNSAIGIDPSAVKNSNSDRAIAQTNRVEHRRDRTDKRRKADITVRHRKNVASPDFPVPFNLGNNKSLTAWRLKGRISWPEPGSTANGGCYVEVLDSTNKAIARIQKWDWATSGDSIPQTIVAGTAQNQNVLVSYSTKHAVRPNTADFQITFNGTNITYKWGNYPELTRSVITSGADASSPRTYRLVYYQTNTQGRDRQTSLLDGEFFDDTPKPTAPASVTFNVGNGTGALFIDGNDLGADANDVIRIAAGTYSVINLQNLTGSPGYPIKVVPTGPVTVAGGGSFFNVNTCNYLTVSGYNASNPSVNLFRNLNINTNNVMEIINSKSGITLEYIDWENAGGGPYLSILNQSDGLVYTGTDATIQMKDLRILHCNFNNSGNINLNGEFATTNGSTTTYYNRGFIKGLEIAYCTFHDKPAPGSIFTAGNVEAYNIHHNEVYNVNRDSTQDAANAHNGIFQMIGNGRFWNNYLHHYAGEGIRAWAFTQGSTPKPVYIYNNVFRVSRKYSAVEIQNYARYVVSGVSTYSDCYVLNNTSDKLDYSGDWIGVMVDVYNLFGGKAYLANNVNARSTNLSGTNGIWSDLTGQTQIITATNTYGATLAAAGLQLNGSNIPVPVSGGILKGSGTYINPVTYNISVPSDYFGFVRANPPSIGAVD